MGRGDQHRLHHAGATRRGRPSARPRLPEQPAPAADAGDPARAQPGLHPAGGPAASQPDPPPLPHRGPAVRTAGLDGRRRRPPRRGRDAGPDRLAVRGAGRRGRAAGVDPGDPEQGGVLGRPDPGVGAAGRRRAALRRARTAARVLLASLGARAWARLGNTDDAHAALARADGGARARRRGRGRRAVRVQRGAAELPRRHHVPLAARARAGAAGRRPGDLAVRGRQPDRALLRRRDPGADRRGDRPPAGRTSSRVRRRSCSRC